MFQSFCNLKCPQTHLSKWKKKKPEPEYHPGNGLELFTFEFEKNTNNSYWYLIQSFFVSFIQNL
jgi:hypothetical protein